MKFRKLKPLLTNNYVEVSYMQDGEHKHLYIQDDNFPKFLNRKPVVWICHSYSVNKSSFEDNTADAWITVYLDKLDF